jgi:hypothetical protein
MAIPFESTYDYRAIVPDDPYRFPWRIEAVGDPRSIQRSHGPVASLWFEPLSPWNGSWTPNPHGRRYVKLAPADAASAPARADFTIDRDVHALMRPGDEFHLTNTYGAGKGISLLRNGRLVVAWGAVTHVPLGPDVHAAIPQDLVDAAERIYRSRDPAFEFFEQPLEVRVGDVSVIQRHTWREAGRYAIHIARGRLLTIPFTDECAWIYDVAILRKSIAFDSSLMRQPATELEWRR